MEHSLLAGHVLLEPTIPGSATLFRIKTVIAHKKTRYQDVLLAELEGFGLALVIDNYIQSTLSDEYLYHETLVHPAMTLHPDPKRILVLGGGEGATLREVLKHSTVKEAVMVDIDDEIVEFAKKYLGPMHRGSFSDPRSRVVIMDGLKYVEEAAERGEEFDVVIMDLTDPYSSEIAKPLYSIDSFRNIEKILADPGVVVTQAGNTWYYGDAYKYVLENMKTVFKHILEYYSWIPAFSYTNHFILGSNNIDPMEATAEIIDKRLHDRGVLTRFFNGRRYEIFKLQEPVYP